MIYEEWGYSQNLKTILPIGIISEHNLVESWRAIKISAKNLTLCKLLIIIELNKKSQLFIL